MTAQVLLETLTARGVVLEAEADGRIHWQGKLTATDKASLAEYKAELLAMLRPKRVAPYLSATGDLVIPFGSDRKYHYWCGGQPIVTTLAELGAQPEVWHRYASEDANLLITHHQRCGGILAGASHGITFCAECRWFIVESEPSLQRTE